MNTNIARLTFNSYQVLAHLIYHYQGTLRRRAYPHRRPRPFGRGVGLPRFRAPHQNPDATILVRCHATAAAFDVVIPRWPRSTCHSARKAVIPRSGRVQRTTQGRAGRSLEGHARHSRQPLLLVLLWLCFTAVVRPAVVCGWPTLAYASRCTREP